MKLLLLYLLISLFYLSCYQQKNEPDIIKDDSRIIEEKFNVLLKRLYHDSTLTLSRYQKLSLKIKQLTFTFDQTHLGDAACLYTDSEKIALLSRYWKKPGQMIYFENLVTTRNIHPAILYGKKIITDSINPYILAFYTKDKNEEMLSLFNIDHHNRKFINKFGRNRLVLLSNYPVVGMDSTDSITLNPFETRIYKIY